MKLVWILAGSIVLVSACSSSAPPPPAPIEVIYGPAGSTTMTPYPSDRYTIADQAAPTGLRVHLTGATSDTFVTTFPVTIAQLEEQDGFSINGGVIVTFSGPLDIRGLVVDKKSDPPILDPIRDADTYKDPDSPMFLIDVDPASPERGTLQGIVPRYWRQDVDPDYTVPDYTLIAQPARPLRERTKYLFVSTNKLKGLENRPIVASAETKRMLTAPADGYENTVASAVGELIAKVKIQKSDITLATVFTTQSVTGSLASLAKRARAQPVPTQIDPWTVEKPLDMDGHIRFRTTLETPEYRDPATQKWHVKNAGAPDQLGKATIEVFLAFSDGAKIGKRPVIIFQHGLGGDKDGTWGTAQRLAALSQATGCAVFGIDSPWHGSRYPGGLPDMLQSVSKFLGVDIPAKTFDIANARDNFRQMASDQLELVRFIDSLGSLDLLPAGAPDGMPDLDVSRILYIGHSFGSVQGPTIFALAPEIKQAVWNVGGGALTVLMRDSGLFSLLVNGIRPPGTPLAAVARFFAIVQALVDAGDSASFARYGTLEALDGVTGWTPRDALLQEVVDDGIVPNTSSEALARAAGLVLGDPLVSPLTGFRTAQAPLTGNLSSGATGVMYPFDKIDNGMMAQHGALIFSPEAQAQYVQFFQTGMMAQHATVVRSGR